MDNEQMAQLLERMADRIRSKHAGPYQHGWAFRCDADGGAWLWSLGSVGYTRQEAIELARNYTDPGNAVRVGRLLMSDRSGTSPIAAGELLDVYEETNSAIDCTDGDVAELQQFLDAAWLSWLSQMSTNEECICDEEEVT